MDFEKELTLLINNFSKENDSNTPDYILAKYLIDCLNIFNNTIKIRDNWHGYTKEKIPQIIYQDKSQSTKLQSTKNLPHTRCMDRK